MVEEELLSRKLFHVTYLGTLNEERIVVKELSCGPIFPSDDLLDEIVEEHNRRNQVKHDHIVETRGSFAEFPRYGFFTKYYEGGSVHSALVTNKEKYRMLLEVPVLEQKQIEENNLQFFLQLPDFC